MNFRMIQKWKNSYKKWKIRKYYQDAAGELEFIKSLSKIGRGSDFINAIELSKSQNFQDIFVLTMLDFKLEGFFVEFGALDGVSISNTFLMEKSYGWIGILAEPSKSYHVNLKKNRDVHIDFSCVWKESNQEILFWEIPNSGLSGLPLGLQKRSDQIKKGIKQRQEYMVKTVSLIDLLQRYNAPKKIDYLSIDTEGTELDILQAFDFKQYQFSVITIEHNFTNERRGQYSLLTSNGYKRVLEDVSDVDDWYILDN